MKESENTQGPVGRPPPHLFMKAFDHLNVWVYRLSGGRLMNKMYGVPICLVTMTGAKTGRRRTIPLMHIPHGDGMLLVASLGGAPRNPAWYHNLRANPEIIVEESGRRCELTARLADAEEKSHLWPICVARYPEFERYQQRTSRDIPVFVCEPRD